MDRMERVMVIALLLLVPVFAGLSMKLDGKQKSDDRLEAGIRQCSREAGSFREYTDCVRKVGPEAVDLAAEGAY